MQRFSSNYNLTKQAFCQQDFPSKIGLLSASIEYFATNRQA